jgi:hypothetical protein
LLSVSLIVSGGTIKDSQDGIFADMLIGHLSANVDKTREKMNFLETDPPRAKPEADSHPNAIPHSVKNRVFLEGGKRNF